MDASLESFIKYRVDRLRDISLEILGETDSNLIPAACGMMSDFCLKRPDSELYKAATGSRLIRKDLKYFFPAVTGIDIRPFTSGSNLEFERNQFEADREAYKTRGAMLRSLSRLMIMTLTYDLFMVDIGSDYDSEAGELQDKVFRLFAEYLSGILEAPPHAQVFRLSSGNVKRRIKNKLSKENHSLILGWLEAGLIPLNPEKLDQFFEEACDVMSPDSSAETLALDGGEKVVVNMKKLLKNPVDDESLLRMMEYRYDFTAYRFMANYFQQEKEKREILFDKMAGSLDINMRVLAERERTVLADFLIGDTPERMYDRAGFYFSPLPVGSKMDWQLIERRAVYLGEKPEDPRVPPNRLPLSKPVTKSAKRPVCVMLDVSLSMSDCIDIGIKSMSIIFGKLRNHPINLVLFSATSGVMNKGTPIISRGKPLDKEIPWLPKIVTSMRDGLNLGGGTSIGNSIMQGKSIALGMATKMRRYNEWMSQNGIAAHCILISDNLHNTPRDISELNSDGDYVVDSDQNVISYAAREGCSIHNLICVSPSDNIDQIIYRMHVMKYIEVISKNYFAANRSGETQGKLIEKELVMTVLNAKPRTVLYQYGDKDRFALVNTWIKSSSLDQLMSAIASFVVYLRKKLNESTEIHDAIEFIGRKFRVGPQDFMGETINMDNVYRIYDLMLHEKEVVLENLNSDIFDTHPSQIFKISHCISETQRLIFPYSTTPVVTSMVEALDRRRDFETDDLRFGLNNLEQLDIFANIITRQIDEMD